MKKIKKKAQRFSIMDLGSIAIALVVAAIILGLGGTILDEVQDTQTVNSTSYNTSTEGLAGIETMAQFIPTIAIVAVAAIVIGIVLVYFARR